MLAICTGTSVDQRWQSHSAKRGREMTERLFGRRACFGPSPFPLRPHHPADY